MILAILPALVQLSLPVAAVVNVRPFHITGTATYRERVALSPHAVFEASLVDVTRADGPSVVVAETRKIDPGQVPISFDLAYDPSRINSRHTYVVRATLREGSDIRFTTDTAYPVLTRNHGRSVAIVMRQAGPRRPSLRVESNRWRPVQIGNKVVKVARGEREPWIELEPRTNHVSGTGGCNRISGSYVLRDDALRFNKLVTTRMACASLATENAFLRVLNETDQYRVRGRTLELYNGNGGFLARLEERNQR